MSISHADAFTVLAVRMACGLLLIGFIGSSATGPAHGETWICVQPDGTEAYADRPITGQCALAKEMRPLTRVPSVAPDAMEDTKPEAPKPVVPPPQAPTQGRGRQIDPPSDATISIHDLKAVPNFNSLLGIANYQATMQLENGDSAWTAEKLCIKVHFRDVMLTFVDVNQVGCLDNLKPMDVRTFTVTYTGMIPPRLFPIQAEATIAFVKWVK